ncbi:unnamed protein product [Pleuronectes platessa]|uniref:Uncharacterized protein n=1 Tax=Pleuronectes platessa TaxID=8262 RepID=A0A9N7Y941_PLEPL|nr:unnamed protein product [Pleuronectes platessa]
MGSQLGGDASVSNRPLCKQPTNLKKQPGLLAAGAKSLKVSARRARASSVSLSERNRGGSCISTNSPDALDAPRSSAGSEPLLLPHWANVNAPSHHPGPEGGPVVCPDMLTLVAGGRKWARCSGRFPG